VLGQTYSNEKYTFFRILNNEIPTVEQLINFDTIIIPGSEQSVLSKTP
jgi:hypothetical protein